MTTSIKRRCAGKACITILSTYNDDPDGLCGACRVAATEAMVARFREQIEGGIPLPEPEIDQREDDHAVETVRRTEVTSVISYTDDDLIFELRVIAAKMGRTPTCEMVKSARPSYSTYVKRFGSWPAAIKAAGLKPIGGNNSGRVMISPSRRALLEELEEAKDVKAIGEAIGRSEKTVRSMLSRAYSRGLVGRYGIPKVGLTGPIVLYHITPAGREALR